MNTSTLFLRQSAEYLREYEAKIERCLGDLTEEQLWYRPNDQSNSIGNLVLHLCGNVRQWIGEGVGGKPYPRQRQQEFDERIPVPRSELLSKLRSTIDEATDALSRLTPDDLVEMRTIQARQLTILEAIYHAVEHFAMHTGQIIWITKAQTASNLQFYDVSGGHPKKNW
jgi:uncharacterized damage-inducible protein DinB